MPDDSGNSALQLGSKECLWRPSTHELNPDMLASFVSHTATAPLSASGPVTVPESFTASGNTMPNSSSTSSQTVTPAHTHVPGPCTGSAKPLLKLVPRTKGIKPS
jgi:hypothetical protein